MRLQGASFSWQILNSDFLKQFFFAHRKQKKGNGSLQMTAVFATTMACFAYLMNDPQPPPAPLSYPYTYTTVFDEDDTGSAQKVLVAQHAISAASLLSSALSRVVFDMVAIACGHSHFAPQQSTPSRSLLLQ